MVRFFGFENCHHPFGETCEVIRIVELDSRCFGLLCASLSLSLWNQLWSKKLFGKLAIFVYPSYQTTCVAACFSLWLHFGVIISSKERKLAVLPDLQLLSFSRFYVVLRLRFFSKYFPGVLRWKISVPFQCLEFAVTVLFCLVCNFVHCENWRGPLGHCVLAEKYDLLSIVVFPRTLLCRCQWVQILRIMLVLRLLQFSWTLLKCCSHFAHCGNLNNWISSGNEGALEALIFLMDCGEPLIFRETLIHARCLSCYGRYS